MIDEEYEVIRILDNNDRLPIHFVCQNIEHGPLKVLQLLLERCPTAASTETVDGKLPLEILEENRSTMTDPDVETNFNAKSDLLFAYHPDILPYRIEEERMERIGQDIVQEL